LTAPGIWDIVGFKYDNFDRQNFSITVVGPEDNLQKGPHEMKGKKQCK